MWNYCVSLLLDVSLWDPRHPGYAHNSVVAANSYVSVAQISVSVSSMSHTRPLSHLKPLLWVFLFSLMFSHLPSDTTVRDAHSPLRSVVSRFAEPHRVKPWTFWGITLWILLWPQPSVWFCLRVMMPVRLWRLLSLLSTQIHTNLCLIVTCKPLSSNSVFTPSIRCLESVNN